MTVETQNSYIIHAGNGVTTQFPYAFRIPEMDMVQVFLLNANNNSIIRQLSNGEFSITGVSIDNYDGGEVTYPLTGSPITTAVKLLIQREAAYTQGLDLENQGGFFPESMEYQLDKLVFQIQQLARNVGRSLKTPLGATLTEGHFPVADASGDLVDGGDAGDIAGAQEAAAIAVAAAQAAQEAAAGVNLPAVAPGDAGKVLTVKPDESGFELRQGGLTLAPLNATLKALNTTIYNTAMTADGRLWAWKTGDYTSRIAADPTEGVFAKADAVAASVGAWVVVTGNKVHSSWFGAVGDRVAGTDGAIVSGDKTYTSATANWTAADVGKVFVAHAAGTSGDTLYTTIASINSATSIELTDAASSTVVSSGRYAYGTDNTNALQRWLDVAQLANPNGYIMAWLDPGAYLVTATIKGRVYVNIDGAGVRWSVIFPAMIAGPALTHDGTVSGAESGYHQFMHHIGFDGSDATKNAQAYTIGGNSKQVDISHNMFWNFEFTNIGVYAAEFRGAGYGVDFEKNHFLNNQRHYRCVRVAGSGNFPTASRFVGNLVEFATEETGTACLWQDASGMIVKDNIVQSNNSLNTLMFYRTAAAETGESHVCDNNWMEANGAGVTDSKAIYVVSDSGTILGMKVTDNKFHGADAAYKIVLNGTDYARVSGNTGGDGTGYGVYLPGTNTHAIVTADGLTGTVDVPS